MFCISTQFIFIWPFARILTVTNTPGKSGPGSDGNERVLNIPQSSSITGTSWSDCLVSYTGHLLMWGLTSLQKSSRCTLQTKLTGQILLSVNALGERYVEITPLAFQIVLLMVAKWLDQSWKYKNAAKSNSLSHSFFLSLSLSRSLSLSLLSPASTTKCRNACGCFAKRRDFGPNRFCVVWSMIPHFDQSLHTTTSILLRTFNLSQKFSSATR